MEKAGPTFRTDTNILRTISERRIPKITLNAVSISVLLRIPTSYGKVYFELKPRAKLQIKK